MKRRTKSTREALDSNPSGGRSPAAHRVATQQTLPPQRRLHGPRATLSLRIALLLAVLLALSATATAAVSAISVRRSETSGARESMANAHKATKLLIDRANADVTRYRSETLATRKAQLKDLLMAQVGALDQLRAAVGRGELTDREARAIAEQMLFTYRYANNDYFFVFTPDMVSVVEPNPSFVGNMIDYQDANGKYFFQEFREVVLTRGDGYVDYVATRAGATLPSPKVSYVFLYKPWNWVIGTGVYLDDIDNEAAMRLSTTKLSLSNALAEVKFNGEGFLFVLDQEGHVVVTPARRDLSALSTTDWGRRLSASLAGGEPSATGEIVNFSNVAQFRSGRSEQWQFDVSSVDSSKWLLVSAVPQAELNSVGNSLAVRQIVIAAAILLVGLLVGLLSSRRIVRPVQALTSAAVALEEDRFDPGTLDRAAARNDEVGALARAFRRMASEIVERERKLRDQVTQLRVVVDRAKVEREVGEITESDFFQRLQERAEEMRRND